MADERGARDGVPQTLREIALGTETYKKYICTGNMFLHLYPFPFLKPPNMQFLVLKKVICSSCSSVAAFPC